MTCQWVAEIGSNHCGNLDRALALIQAAKEVGCDAVKFQLGRHDKLWAPEVRKSKEHLIPYELPLEWLPEISRACDELGLKFGCTPLYLEAVKELEPWVDFYKVAAGEFRWWELRKEIIKTGKPIVLSTGMVTGMKMAEVIMGLAGYDATFLHTVCSYPTKVEHAHLKRMEDIRKNLKVFAPLLRYGYSDHTVNPRVIERAVLHYGAEMVEFHIDISEWGDGGWECGPEEMHSWEPHQIKPVIEFCRVDDGVWPGWEEERKWARGSDGLRPTEEARCKDGSS